MVSFVVQIEAKFADRLVAIGGKLACNDCREMKLTAVLSSWWFLLYLLCLGGCQWRN
jgi:hypothetical protein